MPSFGVVVQDLVTNSYSLVLGFISEFYGIFVVMVGAMLVSWFVSLWRRQ